MRFDKFLREQLQNAELAAVWDDTEPSFKAGDLLVRLRSQFNLSQAQLAEKAGMKRPQIARIESGEANPTVKTLGKILAALSLSLVLGAEPRPRREEEASQECPETGNRKIA